MGSRVEVKSGVEFSWTKIDCRHSAISNCDLSVAHKRKSRK
jgi:hypothetical protein